MSKVTVKGCYRAQVIDNDLVVQDTGDRSNLILDAYLNYDSPTPWPLYLCIGEGVVTPPTFSDTDLSNQIMSRMWTTSGNDWQNKVSEVRRESGGIIAKAANFVEFTGFTGNDVSELGLRVGGASGTLVTRALLTDASGNPSPVTVTAGQTLKLTYTLYFWVPFVLGSGAETTPYGTLSWEAGLQESEINGTQLSSRRLKDLLLCSYGEYATAIVGATTDPDYPHTRVVDVAGRKATILVSAQRKETDQTLGYPEFGARSKILVHSPSMGGLLRWKTDQPILPANYNLVLKWEVSWGRM